MKSDKKQLSNPYNPSFGNKPERFIGRELIVQEIIWALDNPNSPWRTTLVIGVRGSGKTALLNDLMDVIPKKVIVVSITPESDILNDVLGQIHRALPQKIQTKIPKLAKVTFAGTGFELKTDDQEPEYTKTFRYQVTTMLEQAKTLGLKIMFLIDGTQKKSPEMRTFLATYQHMIREKYEVNLVMAGLPDVISDILNDDQLTFLRRSFQATLSDMDLSLVRKDFLDAFSSFSNIDDRTIVEAANQTKGYPYMIQLIGYFLWSNLANGMDKQSAIENSLSLSLTFLYRNVHKLLFDALPNKEKEIALAMAEDSGPSKMAELITRVGITKNQASTYRIRMIDRGYIESAGRGLVSFRIPYTKEYIETESENFYF